MRYAAKVDRNQPGMVDELRGLGFDVDIVHRLKRFCDIIVSGLPTWCDRAVAVRVEVKMPGESLTPEESEYWEKQRHDNLIIARTTEDVLAWFGRG